MTKPVTLSDDAFDALRKEKRPNESTSQTIRRLIQEAHRARRDPGLFEKVRLERALSVEAHRKLLQESDQTDRDKDAWARAKKRTTTRRSGGA